VEIYRDGKKLDGANGPVLILGTALASLDQSVPLRTESCRDRLLRDHGHRGWLDEHFDVADIFDDVIDSSIPLMELVELAVDEIDVSVIMGYERVVVLGAIAWMSLHEALNRRSEAEEIDFQNDMCVDYQLAGYKWLRILRLPSPDSIEIDDEEELESIYMVYRAFVGLVPDRAGEHQDRMERERREAQNGKGAT